MTGKPVLDGRVAPAMTSEDLVRLDSIRGEWSRAAFARRTIEILVEQPTGIRDRIASVNLPPLPELDPPRLDVRGPAELFQRFEEWLGGVGVGRALRVWITIQYQVTGGDRSAPVGQTNVGDGRPARTTARADSGTTTTGRAPQKFARPASYIPIRQPPRGVWASGPTNNEERGKNMHYRQPINIDIRTGDEFETAELFTDMEKGEKIVLAPNFAKPLQSTIKTLITNYREHDDLRILIGAHPVAESGNSAPRTSGDDESDDDDDDIDGDGIALGGVRNPGEVASQIAAMLRATRRAGDFDVIKHVGVERSDGLFVHLVEVKGCFY